MKEFSVLFKSFLSLWSVLLLGWRARTHWGALGEPTSSNLRLLKGDTAVSFFAE
jgi:hypothetical protein